LEAVAETAATSNWTDAVVPITMFGLSVVSVAVNLTVSDAVSVTAKVATPFASVAMLEPAVSLPPVTV
jgi:hypothetical protein